MGGPALTRVFLTFMNLTSSLHSPAPITLRSSSNSGSCFHVCFLHPHRSHLLLVITSIKDADPHSYPPVAPGSEPALTFVLTFIILTSFYIWQKITLRHTSTRRPCLHLRLLDLHESHLLLILGINEFVGSVQQKVLLSMASAAARITRSSLDARLLHLHGSHLLSI